MKTWPCNPQLALAIKGEKKGTRHSSDSWCDYVVVSDSLEGLAPVVVNIPKAEPWDCADIPASNPDNPIDLESSPEPLLRTKPGKRKQAEVEAEAQPAKKVQRRKISRRGNLHAFIAKPPPKKPVSPVHAEPPSAVNEDLSPSPPHTLISEQLESSKAAEAEAENSEVEKPVEVKSEKIVDPKTVDVDVTHPKSPKVVARDPKKGKSVSEDPAITIPSSPTTPSPVNVEKNPAGDEGFFAQVDDSSPICPDETSGDYYYRCYSVKKASEIHTPVWNFKKGDTFSDWRVCRDRLQGTFPPGEIKFQEGRPHEQTYHAYVE
ncbi:hypothetical protein HanIR_Chr04g0173511 [Helianthus annuus]|nr:hypothetical protein HanIR_Chr04g0173511 [Helianthus annuus]